VKRAIAQLAAAEGRLLSIRDELSDAPGNSGSCSPAIKDRVGHGKWMIWLRMATLADAPDLGLRNHRFQNVPFRFKKQSIYERKTRFFTISIAFTTGE
jgi:hypothetical protein